MKKIIITVEETRRIEREFEISDEDFEALNHDAPEDIEDVNGDLQEAYGEILDAKDADTENDYSIRDSDDNIIVPFTN